MLRLLSLTPASKLFYEPLMEKKFLLLMTSEASVPLRDLKQFWNSCCKVVPRAKLLSRIMTTRKTRITKMKTYPWMLPDFLNLASSASPLFFSSTLLAFVVLLFYSNLGACKS